MSHLIEEYAKSCGVKIGKPVISPSFYPISFDRYITVNHGSCPATTYPYWEEVFQILKNTLHGKNIKVVQILNDKEEIVDSCDKAIKATKKQSLYIVKNAMAHIGTDSIYCNYAGENCVPLVAIFSHTNPANTGPWRMNPKITKIINSIKEKKPSYDPNEPSKTINSIHPEIVAQSILDVLNIKKKVKFKTLFAGDRFKVRCIDIVPMHPINIQSDRINVRMDIHHNEKNLYSVLRNNICEVTTAAPISSEILNLRKISIINYMAEEFDADFVERVKSLGIHMNLLCLSKDKLADQRFKFFQYEILFHDLQSKAKENLAKLAALPKSKIKIKSGKKIIIGDKQYSSYLEALKSEELFSLDLEWSFLYSEEHD